MTGTFWLSVSNIICKVLGIAYLIPWLILMGSIEDQQSAQALYNVAYLPYALFLSLGTAGFGSESIDETFFARDFLCSQNCLFKLTWR